MTNKNSGACSASCKWAYRGGSWTAYLRHPPPPAGGFRRPPSPTISASRRRMHGRRGARRSGSCGLLLGLVVLGLQGRAAGQGDVVALECSLLGHPDAELDLQVGRVLRVAASAVHLGRLHTDLLGHALLVVLEAGVDLDVPVAALGDEELERPRVPEVLAAHEGLLVVRLVLDHDSLAALAADLDGLQGVHALLLHHLDLEGHNHVLGQGRVAVAGLDVLPVGEDLLAREIVLLVRGDEAVAVELVVARDGSGVGLLGVGREALRQRLRLAAAAAAAALAAAPALAAALAPALAVAAAAALTPALRTAHPHPRHGSLRRSW
mmetsp:Transcript_86325/g.186578  ORF Transcript_86325/g.186578 Transcript_86325/m.186578 type:complete len:322 (+) Transcript_86325:470-1435(+)